MPNGGAPAGVAATKQLAAERKGGFQGLPAERKGFQGFRRKSS